MITHSIGNWIISAVLILLAIHYTYELAYQPATQQILEFLQEKMLADPLPPGRKTSTAYSNLFRVVNCIQQKLGEKQRTESSDGTDHFSDSEETQPNIDF